MNDKPMFSIKQIINLIRWFLLLNLLTNKEVQFQTYQQKPNSVNNTKIIKTFQIFPFNHNHLNNLTILKNLKLFNSLNSLNHLLKQLIRTKKRAVVDLRVIVSLKQTLANNKIRFI